jgi:hypothetical protein
MLGAFVTTNASPAATNPIKMAAQQVMPAHLVVPCCLNAPDSGATRHHGMRHGSKLRKIAKYKPPQIEQTIVKPIVFPWSGRKRVRR